MLMNIGRGSLYGKEVRALDGWFDPFVVRFRSLNVP